MHAISSCLSAGFEQTKNCFSRFPLSKIFFCWEKSRLEALPLPLSWYSKQKRTNFYRREERFHNNNNIDFSLIAIIQRRESEHRICLNINVCLYWRAHQRMIFRREEPHQSGREFFNFPFESDEREKDWSSYCCTEHDRDFHSIRVCVCVWKRPRSSLSLLTYKIMFNIHRSSIGSIARGCYHWVYSANKHK